MTAHQTHTSFPQLPLALEHQQRAVETWRSSADLQPLEQPQAMLGRQVLWQRFRAQLQTVQWRHRHALATRQSSACKLSEQRLAAISPHCSMNRAQHGPGDRHGSRMRRAASLTYMCQEKADRRYRQLGNAHLPCRTASKHQMAGCPPKARLCTSLGGRC